jgi:hypothetical protein
VLADKNGVRGLYSAKSFNLDVEERKTRRREVEAGVTYSQDESDLILKVPNKLLITPYHVGAREFVPGITYNVVFSRSPELFDPKYPYKPKKELRSKFENDYGDYFKLTFFLISERLKGERSFFEPFISYLPKEIHTLYTYPDDTKI